MKRIIRSIMMIMVMAIGLAMPVFAASGGVEATSLVPAHDLVLRPVLRPIGYSISYDLDGGTVATANPTSYNIESGDITLNNPTKEGYEFTGWTGSNGYSPSKSVTIQSGKTGDLSFTANWELATYSITYDLDGGTVATANPTSYNYFTDTFILNNPTREGYTFLGWTGSNGSTAQTTVTVEQGSAGDLTYTANWDALEYTVTFNANGGTVDVSSKTVTYGQKYGELPTPYKKNNTFLGWYTSIYGDVERNEDTIVTLTSDEVLYAHWLSITDNNSTIKRYSLGNDIEVYIDYLGNGNWEELNGTTEGVVKGKTLIKVINNDDSYNPYTWKAKVVGIGFQVDAYVISDGNGYNTCVFAFPDSTEQITLTIQPAGTEGSRSILFELSDIYKSAEWTNKFKNSFSFTNS